MKLTPEQSQMVEENIKLAFFTANKFKAKVKDENIMEYRELVSIAFESLIHATQRYKPNRGMSFSSWAIRVITWAIKDEIRKIKKSRIPWEAMLEYALPYATIDEVQNDQDPQINGKFSIILTTLRNFKGTQREKAVAIMFVRNPYLNPTELAKMTGVNRSIVYLGISKFQEQLQEKMTG